MHGNKILVATVSDLNPGIETSSKINKVLLYGILQSCIHIYDYASGKG
jgi:hypothetical protein